MMETLMTLRTSINDPNVTSVMSHPEWPQAYERLLKDMELPFRPKDVGRPGVLAYVLTSVAFSLDDEGRILMENLQFGYSSYAWVNGEWVDVDG